MLYTSTLTRTWKSDLINWGICFAYTDRMGLKLTINNSNILGETMLLLTVERANMAMFDQTETIK